MGQIFHSGTFTVPGSAMTDPDTGQMMAVGSPSQIKSDMFKVGAQNNQTQHPYLPGENTNAAPQRAEVSTPSFAQAASAGATPGGGNATSPGLTKAGKLAVLLTSGLQGALAGRQASEQAVLQSGGHRGGGVGTGFEAGYMLPWQRAGAAQNLAQQQAQTELLRSQSEMVPTSYGMLPVALAKAILPAQIRGQAGEQQAQTRAQAGVQQAQIGHRFVTVPGIGLYDTQKEQMVPGTAQGITITPDIANDFNLPQQYVGKPMPLNQFSSLQNAQRFTWQPVEGAAGPALVNRSPSSPEFGKVMGLGLGNPSQGRIIPVAPDPNNPGDIRYMTAGQAASSDAQSPQSAGSRAARSTAVSATSGPIGQQITAFNTALQHADLLEKALGALNNGDVRTLNSLKNRFKTEFGSSDVTNLQAITNAYSREITKMLAAGHMTDAEIGSAGATMPLNASPAQMLGALQAYRNLAQSKMNVLQQQVQQGMKGKPNFPTSGASIDSLVQKYGGR
ncbi:MAG TPA: hypothetical protein VN517_16265 [Terriglobales bacterium]|nr:hypothetical protein [Terriglobales bacterium]